MRNRVCHSRSRPRPLAQRRRARAGVTLVEQVVVLALLGVLLALALARSLPLLDALAVETAAAEAADLLAFARDQAWASGTRVAVRIDASGRRVVVHRGSDTLARAEFAERRIALQSTRDSMAYGPDALGVGAANLRLVLARGGRADTLTVSRLGRVQRR